MVDLVRRADTWAGVKSDQDTNVDLGCPFESVGILNLVETIGKLLAYQQDL